MLVIYDGSIEGLFTVIFECYNRQPQPEFIVNEQNYQPKMFDKSLKVNTDSTKAQRVLRGLERKVSAAGLLGILKCFHSEYDDIGLTIYQYAKLAFSSPVNIERDYRQPPVLRINQVVKMVNREIHRMHAFVRFQKTVDDIYASTIVPDFDVIPFIGSHFKKRYADQQWLIYDVKRDYGIYYDLQTMKMINLESPAWSGKQKIRASSLSEEEKGFQKMWKTYFDSTCIKERRNMRLHLQHLPRRYWHYLPEKFLS